MLIDAGDRVNTVVNYLKAQGINQLDLVIGTHPQADHIGGLINVFQSISVAEVVDPGVVHTTKTFEDYLTLIDQKDIPSKVQNTGVLVSHWGCLALITLLMASAVIAGQNRYIEFDAHMAKDNRSAKRSMLWYQWKGSPVPPDLPSPTFDLDVKYVSVDGNAAWFAVGPAPRGFLVIKVVDGGTPGTNGDEISAVWVSEDTAISMVGNMDGTFTHEYDIYRWQPCCSLL